jgi:hypothetical protein
MKRLMSFWMLMMVALLPAMMHVAVAGPVPEYEMKAAYLYNFATLTTWPSQTDKNVRLCVLGKDNFGNALEGLTRNSTGGIKITLSYLPNIEAAKTCNVLFIDGSERGNASEILKQLEKLPVLTVTDSLDLFQSGTMIGMFLENNRLAFEVNYALAQNAKLTMSSQLLRVARKVH